MPPVRFRQSGDDLPERGFCEPVGNPAAQHAVSQCAFARNDQDRAPTLGPAAQEKAGEPGTRLILGQAVQIDDCRRGIAAAVEPPAAARFDVLGGLRATDNAFAR
jgi:hypothetical protein